MLVKCYDDPDLREWYTVNSRAEVMTNNLMNWTPETGLRLNTEKNLYQRRTSAAGTVLKISTVKEERPTSLTTNIHGEDLALFPRMMMDLASHMNFNIDFVSSNDAYGLWNAKRNQWSGILGKLQSNEIDVAIAEITMTKERLDAFDFACPLVLSQAKLFIKEPGYSDVKWNAYLKAFNINIWLSLIILIILSALLLTYMKTKISKVTSLKNYIVESHLYVWGIYCQQGLSEFPDSSSLRIAYVSIFFSAIVLSAIYSASIISYLTIFSPTVPFTSLPKYVQDGSYKLIVVRHSAEHEMFATSKDHILQKMNKLMVREADLPKNDIEAFAQVCRARVAYYSNDAMKNKLGDTIPCKLISIGTGRVDNLAFALTKNNPYTEFINYNILRFQDSGLTQRMKKINFKKPIKPMKVYDSVGLWGIVPLIIILTFGAAISVLLLLLENVYYYKTRYKINYFNSITSLKSFPEITPWR